MRRASLSTAMVALAATTLGAACSSEDVPVSEGYVTTTTVSINPETFSGELACSSSPGSFRTYVVTLEDKTDENSFFTLPSSPPVSCASNVAFALTLPKHTYHAYVDGYDLPPSALTPLGGSGSGSRHLVRAADGAPVEPRWSTSCTEVTAVASTTTFVETCAAFVAGATPTTTAIAVDPSAALGQLACAADSGSVASFDVLPADPALPAAIGLGCDGATATYGQGLTPGQTYLFRVEARAEKGGPVTWGAQCFAIPKEGFTVPAVCDPLSSSGVIEIPIGEILEAKALACAKDVATYEATLVGSGLSGGLVACDKPVRFAPLDPGDYEVSVRAFAADGAEVTTIACAAKVTPGAVTKASCP